jgi:chaperonin GroES
MRKKEISMNELIIVGDRVLISPDDGDRQTEAGLYLPATVAERERVQGGRVVRVGPGYIMPNPEYSGEAWAAQREAVRYLPLQARAGDYAFFLRKDAIEIKFEGKDYLIVSSGAILVLVRPRPDLPDDVDPDDIDLGNLLD